MCCSVRVKGTNGVKCSTYRGRLRKGQLLVLADQQSEDDLFTARALTGNVGQHLQAMLRAIGLTTRYAIIRTLPVHTLGENAANVRAAADDPATRKIHREVLRRLRPKVVVTLGAHAERIAADESPSGTRIVNLAPFRENNLASAWRPAVNQLKSIRFPKDLRNPTNRYNGDREPIARIDLPFGTLRWQGTTGSRAQQGKLSNRLSPDYFRHSMPTWTSRLAPTQLTSDELDAVGRLP